MQVPNGPNLVSHCDGPLHRFGVHLPHVPNGPNLVSHCDASRERRVGNQGDKRAQRSKPCQPLRPASPFKMSRVI